MGFLLPCIQYNTIGLSLLFDGTQPKPHGAMADQSVFAKAEPKTRFSWLPSPKPTQSRRRMNPSGWLEAYNAKLSGSFEDFKDVLVILGIALLVVHYCIYLLQIPIVKINLRSACLLFFYWPTPLPWRLDEKALVGFSRYSFWNWTKRPGLKERL